MPISFVSPILVVGLALVRPVLGYTCPNADSLAFETTFSDSEWPGLDFDFSALQGPPIQYLQTCDAENWGCEQWDTIFFDIGRLAFRGDGDSQGDGGGTGGGDGSGNGNGDGQGWIWTEASDYCEDPCVFGFAISNAAVPVCRGFGTSPSVSLLDDTFLPTKGLQIVYHEVGADDTSCSGNDHSLTLNLKCFGTQRDPSAASEYKPYVGRLLSCACCNILTWACASFSVCTALPLPLPLPPQCGHQPV